VHVVLKIRETVGQDATLVIAQHAVETREPHGTMAVKPDKLVDFVKVAAHGLGRGALVEVRANRWQSARRTARENLR